MTKQDLVAAMASTAGVSKRVASDTLEAFIDTITKTLKKGETITITSFGTFSPRKRAARMGVNPRNKEPLKIPAMKIVGFKAGKVLKETIR